MIKINLQYVVCALFLGIVLSGCNLPAPDPAPVELHAPCLKPLTGVLQLARISITTDETKAIASYARGYEMRMFIADLPSATVTRHYYGSPSKSNGLQWSAQWIGDSKTRFWGTDDLSIAELDENLNRSNAQPCPACIDFVISRNGRFAFYATRHTFVYDKIGGKEILQIPGGNGRMSFSPDDRFLSVLAITGTQIIDLVNNLERIVPENNLNPAWLNNVTLLVPDQKQPVIWEYNVETGDKKEFVTLRPAQWTPQQRIAGVTANGNMRYLVIMTSNSDAVQYDLHVLDMECQRNLPSQ